MEIAIVYALREDDVDVTIYHHDRALKGWHRKQIACGRACEVQWHCSGTYQAVGDVASEVSP